MGSPYQQGFINNLLNPKGSLFYLGVFSQVITPDTLRWQTASLIAVMLSVSAVFWVLFVEALHQPMIRWHLERSTVAINRVFGVVLIVIGASTALLK
jgi:threonine/homoserine/homoserine lactone efflux protein